ncbi:MAG: hypothetical protein JW915_20700 [Chitinispirillaceae bacterium]|nr:hypothetical protein [Chitinispirillaceae bacterium]
MSTEVLLLALACGLTLLAYMVAINAHGPTRLSLSYLIATIMLAGTVWCIVQYVNTGLDTKKIEELRRLEKEKRLAEERALSTEEKLKNKERLIRVAHINKIITAGSGYTTSLINIELQDETVDVDVLLGRTSEMKKNIDQLNTEFESVPIQDASFTETVTIIRDALKLLTEAAYYYRLYYQSDDSSQEANRERVLRQRARAAYELFQKAGTKVAGG